MSEELDVTGGPLVSGGDSLVRRPGKKVLFVEGLLPDEVARVQISADRKDLQRGTVLDIRQPSAERIPPPCPMFRSGCGGCQWQHASDSAQHTYKTGIVRDALARIAKRSDLPVRFGGSVPPFGYRTSMRFAVVNGQAALHARHSKNLVALDQCLIAHSLLHDLITDTDFGDATEVTVRASVTTDERLLVTNATRSPLVPDDVRVVQKGDTASLHEHVLGRNFRISSNSFFQSGHAAAELLARTVDAALPTKASWLVDAYSGVGLLGSVAAASRSCRLTAIESNASSASDARYNLADLDAEILEMEVAELSHRGSTSPDVVVADPARTGLGKSATRALAGLRAPVLVLVSCDPASLARDIGLLADHGYEPEGVVVLDLFPQTHHVEAVTTFKLA